MKAAIKKNGPAYDIVVEHGDNVVTVGTAEQLQLSDAVVYDGTEDIVAFGDITASWGLELKVDHLPASVVYSLGIGKPFRAIPWAKLATFEGGYLVRQGGGKLMGRVRSIHLLADSAHYAL